MDQSQQPKKNSMATASLVLGGLAIVLSFLIPAYALCAGCLSILFATLSRGSGLKMPDKALMGLIISIVALCLAVLVALVFLYLHQLLNQRFGIDIIQDPQALQKLLTELQTQTGGPGL